MQVLPTDAFDDEQLESLTANLTSKQIGWLQAKAADQDVSVDHVLRSVLTAQMQQETQSLSEPSRERRGDGGAASSSRSSLSPDQASSNSPHPAGRDASDGSRDESRSRDESSSHPEADDAPSIVESLRSASERLQNLTDEGDETNDTSSSGRDADDLAESAQDTLDRLRSRLGRTNSDDDASVLTENQAPSMFDMMEDEEDR